MGQKKMIDKAEVERVQKSNTAGYYTALGFILLGAVLSIIFIPLPLNLLAAILFLGGAYLMYRSRKKNGGLQVYFSQKPLVRKSIKHVPGSEDDDTEAPYFDFGDHECMVSDKLYKKTAEGALFFVMYNARNNQIVDCYPADEYDIDPSLDIR